MKVYMAQGPIFSGDMDPDIAALLGGDVQAPAARGKSPAGPGRSANDLTPDFDALFGGMDLTADVKPEGPSSVDLTKRRFAAIAKFEDDPPNKYFADPEFYKNAMAGGSEEAQAFHQVFTRYMQTQDLKDKSIIRQKLIPAYWNLAKRLALGCASKDFPVQKLVALRFGALIPNLLSAEQRLMLEKVVSKNATGEPVYYIDEWIRMVATNQLKASSTDEVRVSRMDDKQKFQTLLERARGKKDAAEGILRVKAEERKAMEGLVRQKMDFISSHDSQPGMLHIPMPYTESQRKAFSEVADLFRQMANADRELQKSIQDFEAADAEMNSINDKANGVSDNVKADLQTVAQEFETLRQMAKMCIGRQGNHFPILVKDYFHGSIREIGSRENVIQAMALIESVDAEAFCRSYKTQLNRIVPYVILMPSYGDYGICWEAFDRFNRATSRGRIAVPMFPKNLTLAVLTAVADLRWQTAKEKASYYWMEEGLTGNYYQNFVSKKLKGDVKEYFIADYILWITKESDGVQKLDKEVRSIFWRYVPFTQEIKDKLKNRSYVYQELCQRDTNRSMSDGY
jgi:hypothetical protein